MWLEAKKKMKKNMGKILGNHLAAMTRCMLKIHD